MAKPLPYQEEIEYTRALDDQDGNSFWRPSLLQFQNVTFYLQVEGHVLELEQAGAPEGVPVLVIQSPGVLYLLLVREGLGHVVVPTLGADDVAGEGGQGYLLVTGPVWAPHKPEPTGLLMS